MPELPEVQTTVTSLSKILTGKKITDIWSDYNSAFHTGKKNIKDIDYFVQFKKRVVNKKVLRVKRRAKNILIELEGGTTILIHMKMTGHFLYGHYSYNKSLKQWQATDAGPLQDPFNKFIRLVIQFSVSSRVLAFSDMRKFAKITLFPTSEEQLHLGQHLGPEPLEKNFDFVSFKERLLRRPKGKIKQVLMDQSVIAGIGNIYSDEMLWMGHIHPLSVVQNIADKPLQALFKEMKKILKKSIDLRGDSASDFRDIEGNKGGFQKEHRAYRLTGRKCSMDGCAGTITRLKVGGRSAHFCNIHQVLF